MDLNEAIPIMVVGFMALIGFWLVGLTYLVFKKQRNNIVEKDEEDTEEDINKDIKVDPAE